MPALEPLYTLRQAAELVPFTSLGALEKWLSRYAQDWPRRYRHVGRGKRRHRLLLQSEVLEIRTRIETRQLKSFH